MRIITSTKTLCALLLVFFSFSLFSPVHASIINPFPNQNIVGDVIGVVCVIAAVYYAAEGVSLINQKIRQEGWINSNEISSQDPLGRNISAKPKSIFYLHPSPSSAWVLTLDATTECEVVEESNNSDGRWFKVSMKKSQKQ